ncbi:putative protein DDB [Capsicum annuum]
MTLPRNFFILFTIFIIIIIMSLSSSYSVKFLDNDDDNILSEIHYVHHHNLNNLEREFGYDFQAYPSNYFNTILGHEGNNNNNIPRIIPHVESGEHDHEDNNSIIPHVESEERDREDNNNMEKNHIIPHVESEERDREDNNNMEKKCIIPQVESGERDHEDNNDMDKHRLIPKVDSGERYHEDNKDMDKHRIIPKVESGERYHEDNNDMDKHRIIPQVESGARDHKDNNNMEKKRIIPQVDSGERYHKDNNDMDKNRLIPHVESGERDHEDKNLEIISRFHRFKNLEKDDDDDHEDEEEAKVATISVDSFGAQGDGSIDDTNAFQKAWKEVCSSSNVVNFLVSQNKKYLLKPIKFSGPCKSSITMQVYGTLLASDNTSDYNKDSRHWLIFQNVENLVVGGGGVINGNGKIWWLNSCKINKKLPCKHAPTALTFHNCNNLKVKDLKIEDAQQMHLTFERCFGVEASNLVVSAPESSPNTDGIHITKTQNIQISDSIIGTGDDCISIVSGSQKVLATGITCGPGHGISIGSLGAGNSEAHVSDINVNGAKLSGTTNGLRIKTWQGGSGSASNIRFQNVVMNSVKNPIIIDQNYCDQDTPCKDQDSAVQVKNVIYQNIKGTSATNEAINFKCSKNFPCQGILLENVKLLGENGETPGAIWENTDNLTCNNVSPECPRQLS